MSEAYMQNRLEIKKPVDPHNAFLLSEECMKFLGELVDEFKDTRDELLSLRKTFQDKLLIKPEFSFPDETREIRESSWKVAPLPEYLQDRRVEITGPSGDRKMVINAFNSGAKVYMSDFEDAQSPTWNGLIQGQKNLFEAVRGKLKYTAEDGKEYSIGQNPANLFVRPRGLHLPEKNVLMEGVPIPGAFFDFGVFIFNNGQFIVNSGKLPCFYIPKTESYLEARLWNNIFSFAEDYLKIRRGSIKATFLIETLPAAFNMDEILYEVREHSAGLNCGRWDYIFSYIKKLRNFSEFVLPDRNSVSMDKGFLLSYAKLLIKTCHKRGAHAMGGMSAFIPVKGNEKENVSAMNKVREDKEREVGLGHDGTWVAHPGLVPVAMEVFNKHMKTPNQIDKQSQVASITEADLLKPISGEITENGLRTNISVGIQYLQSWLSGKGAAPINHLMEDAATAEISRSQLWQWIRHNVKLTDGRTVDTNLVNSLLNEEVRKLPESRYLIQASEIFREISFNREFTEFMTLAAYDTLLKNEVIQ
jgi:malate synthase